MVRRWPIYILLDCSESTPQDHAEELRNCLRETISNLRNDPYALELAHIALITFGDEARVEIPLTELYDEETSDIRFDSLGKGRKLGEAMKMAADDAESQVRKTSADVKWDYRPTLLLLLGGEPTDDWKEKLPEPLESFWNVVVISSNTEAANSLEELNGDYVFKSRSSEKELDIFRRTDPLDNHQSGPSYLCCRPFPWEK
jgi:uncharacterized protein YegL